MTVLIGVAWTIIDLVLIVGWQVSIFFRDGNWHALPLSSVLKGSGGSASTASIYKIGTSYPTNLGDGLLQIPIIVPLLLGAALLIAFYFWLSNTERRYSKN
jgi:hypothetical protein